MNTVRTIGLDIAKPVFQVHGIDAAGEAVIRRQLRRAHVLAFFAKLPPCLVGIEACATSHYWSRELQARGHTVKLMPPAYVKRQKNDAADAEAICEAVQRPNMRFVPTKMPEQQSCLMLHRARHLLIRQQTAVINSIRAYLAEFGIVAPVGRKGVEELLYTVADPNNERIPGAARLCLEAFEALLAKLYRRAGGYPLCGNPRHEIAALACQAAGPAANKVCRDRAGEQDSPALRSRKLGVAVLSGGAFATYRLSVKLGRRFFEIANDTLHQSLPLLPVGA